MEIKRNGDTWIIPDNSIIVMVDIATLSVAEYARREGRSRNAVSNDIQSGLIKIEPKANKKGSVKIRNAEMIADQLVGSGHNVVYLA